MGPVFPEPVPDPLLEHQLAAMATAAVASSSTTLAGSGVTPSTSTPATDTLPPGITLTPPAIGAPGAPSPFVTPPLGFVPMAPLPPAVPELLATFAHTLYLGECSSYTFEAGSLKSAAHGSAPGEVRCVTCTLQLVM